MTRRELAKFLAENNELDVKTVENLIGQLFDLIAAALSEGQEVKLINFGKFEPRKQAAVKRRNPRTGEPVLVPEKMSLGFKPAASLKAQVNGTA